MPALAREIVETVAFVREARTRSFECRACGLTVSMLASPKSLGRFPAKCEACEPTSMTWVRERAERPLRAAIIALARRVDELEAALAGGAPAARATRARHLGEPGKAALGRAVRIVAYAQGRHETAAALRELSRVAREWAGVLSSSPADIVEALEPELREAG